ncbi:MAG: hypothetical protein NUV58_04460 [Candidatus Roizmanbacteria bacterium]|nr:hypothetical protein [Candidatus Roizmanbacteria bacterium]
MNPDIENTLRKKTKKALCGLFYSSNYGNIYFRSAEDDYILKEHQGTLTFVEYKGECYAITNQHVIGENWQEHLKKNSLIIALDKHKFWGISPIFVSPPKSVVPD